MMRAKGTAARIPGGNVEGVMSAQELLQKAADGKRMRLRGETVVAGSGDDAAKAALAARQFGSEKVTLVCPEPRKQTRISEKLLAQLAEADVRLVYGWGPLRIDEHTDRRVSGVFFKHCERAFDGQGRFDPIFDESNVMGQYCDNAVLE